VILGKIETVPAMGKYAEKLLETREPRMDLKNVA
jgi:hypothetical protein